MAAFESALILKLQALRESMSKTEIKVTNYILEHPREVIYLSITGLAGRCGVSDASVVRLCKRLGMRGYQELKVLLALDMVNPINGDHEQLQPTDTNEQIVNKVFQNTIHSLQYTMRILDVNAFSGAVDAISKANRVVIFGMGGSYALVEDLQNKLLRVGCNVLGLTDFLHQQIAGLYLQKSDVCIAISQAGTTPELIKAVQYAKECNATIISMTSIGRNPLTELADIRLDCASTEDNLLLGASPDRIAVSVINNCLYAALSMRIAQRGGETLQTMDHLIDPA